MVKIKNLKVSSKLSFIIFISTISMIIIGIIGYSQMDKMSKHIDEIYNNSMLSVQTMDNIESNFHAQDAYLLEFVMTNDEEKHNKLNEKLQKNIQDNEKMMKLYEQTKKTSDEQKVYEAFKSDLTVYAKKS
ncbi:MCP four helix bundle domain-containing protein [Bacillus cytotoxicus]